MQEDNLLYEEREGLLVQMMQARAIQSGYGGLGDLSEDTIDLFRRDVLLRLAEYDLFFERSLDDLLPESPFEALMVRWLAFDAVIREIEGQGNGLNSVDIDT